MTEARDVDVATDAVRRQSWAEAYELFQGVDPAALDPDQLEAMADAAWWTSHLEESMALRRRAVHGFLEAGENRRAAYGEWFLAMDHLFRGEGAVTSGLLMRARRHLENEPECYEQGLILMTDADAAKEEGDLQTAAELAERVIGLGARCRSPDLVAMGVQTLGRIKIAQGSAKEGMALLDEAMSAVLAGELTPVITGWIYCSVLGTCAEVADLRRAAEWTEAANAWAESTNPGSPYHSECRLFRVEISDLRGGWEEAQADAVRCSRELIDIAPYFAGEAYYWIGDIRRRRGELTAAEIAFKRALELGRDPQPGLALLRLAQGNAQAADAALRISLSSGTGSFVHRVRLLAAQVETSLALGDLTAASVAAEEIGEVAAEWKRDLFQASAAAAHALVALAHGDAEGASSNARRAWSLWQELKAPYEAARARVLLGLAARAAGHEEGAVFELTAAKEAFERLGARVDARKAEELLSPTENLPKGLTRREVEILRQVASGKTNREIAQQMFISEHTVSRHLQNIFTKLDVSSRSAATAFAFEHHLV